MIPVIESLADRVRVSIDTTKEEVAEAAVGAGASLINDVSASLWPVAARHRVGWVAMHRKGTPDSMQVDPRYDDVVREVSALLVDRAERARRAGVTEVWIDPGIGFGKTVDHNVRLLASLSDLVDTGYPVLVGTSRKSFLGALARSDRGAAIPTDERLPGSLATATWAMSQGARMVRVHDVSATVQAAVLVGALGNRRPGDLGSDQNGPDRRRRGPPRGRRVKGKWAAGIPPRNFTWVIKDRLAMSERPGGFAPNHRKVRRQEEIIWLQVQGFTRVISLLPSSHNLQAYEERSLASVHFPLPPSGDARAVLADLYRELHGRLTGGGAAPHPSRGAGRSGHRRGCRLPPLVGPAARAVPRPSPSSST